MTIEEEIAKEYFDALNNGNSHEEKERIYWTYINNIEILKMNFHPINRELLKSVKSEREKYIENYLEKN